jgi:hypothetical protein
LESVFLWLEDQSSPLSAYAELSDVLYRVVGAQLLKVFDCADFDDLEEKEEEMVGHTLVTRALRYGSGKAEWTGLRLARIPKEEFWEVVSVLGGLLREELNAVMCLLHRTLMYEEYPVDVAVACAKKLKRVEERLRGTKVTRWLDLFAYVKYES